MKMLKGHLNALVVLQNFAIITPSLSLTESQHPVCWENTYFILNVLTYYLEEQRKYSELTTYYRKFIWHESD